MAVGSAVYGAVGAAPAEETRTHARSNARSKPTLGADGNARVSEGAKRCWRSGRRISRRIPRVALARVADVEIDTRRVVGACRKTDGALVDFRAGNKAPCVRHIVERV